MTEAESIALILGGETIQLGIFLIGLRANWPFVFMFPVLICVGTTTGILAWSVMGWS